jgi:putative endonuclease
MTFWAYMLHCNGGYFYTGHTDDLEHRMAQHAHGQVQGFVRDHWPAKLVWSADFATRYEALSAERQIKGWSRAKKLALIRGDWDTLSGLARNRKKQGQGFDRLSPNGEGVVAELMPHPLHPPHAIDRIEVHVERAAADRLHLAYWVFGDMDELRLAAPAAPLRTDNLWQTTCFEAFFARPDTPAYRELNFSPSTQWAAYDFQTYRDPNPRDARLPEHPAVALALRRADRLLLTAGVAIELGEARWRLGLSAVIDERNGTRSFWALAHPNPDKPDFHHPAGFVLELPA